MNRRENKRTRIMAFASRNAKEMLRDPLSYIFALGFPVIMLIVMTIVNESIPAQAAMDIFQVQNLAPGIVVFGLTFVMQFTAILLSKDRSSAFLNRLMCAPMSAKDFLIGYISPVLLLAVMQCVVTYAAGEVVALVSTGKLLNPLGCLLSIVLLLPVMIVFISLGIIFGGLFGEKSAPGISSIIITVAGILGGIWMDVKTIGGVILGVSQALPFYPSTYLARRGVNIENGLGDDFWMNLGITCAYGAVLFAVACAVFNRNMKRDK